MSRLVLVDSQIFIWGLKGQAVDIQDPEITKAKKFIKWLSDNEFKILMPTPQLAELLSCVPAQEQDKIRHLIDKRFVIVPFDEIAALKCGELMNLTLKNPELIQYRTEEKIRKNKLKFDCMIIAIAITRGVHKVYSMDPDMTKFAHGQIEVSEMPIIHEQVNLFSEQ